MKIEIPVDGIVREIVVPLRVWLGIQVLKLGEWLVGPGFKADVNLVGDVSQK